MAARRATRTIGPCGAGAVWVGGDVCPVLRPPHRRPVRGHRDGRRPVRPPGRHQRAGRSPQEPGRFGSDVDRGAGRVIPTSPSRADQESQWKSVASPAIGRLRDAGPIRIIRGGLHRWYVEVGGGAAEPFDVKISCGDGPSGTSPSRGTTGGHGTTATPSTRPSAMGPWRWQSGRDANPENPAHSSRAIRSSSATMCRSDRISSVQRWRGSVGAST